MNNVTQQDFHCSIVVNSTAREATDNINNVSAWWAINFEGHSKKAGDVFTIHFGTTSVTFKVMEIVPGKKVLWHVTDSHLPWLKDKKEWNNTEVLFEISSSNNATQIDFTHIGLIPEVECYEMCEKGWTHFVKESLFKLLTEHKGMPEATGGPR